MWYSMYRKYKIGKTKIRPKVIPPPHPNSKNCPKNERKQHSMQRKVGLSENPPKKHKKAIKTKRPGSNISELNFSECTHQDLSENV